MHSLTLIVPILNEEVLLPEFLDKTVSDLDASGLDWELLLVNDGSTDGTLGILERFAAKQPRARVIDLERNVGPGANMSRAYAEAAKEFVTYATVDSFYDTRLLGDLMANFDECDAVSAYRTDLVAHTPLRRLQTLSNIVLQRVMFPYRFRAYHTLQIHRTDFIQAAELEAKTPFLCSEMLFKATELGLKVREVAIPYLPRKAGKATGGQPTLIISHVAEMLRFWARWRILRRPVIPPTLKISPRTSLEPVRRQGGLSRGRA